MSSFQQEQQPPQDQKQSLQRQLTAILLLEEYKVENQQHRTSHNLGTAK
jgi:hypothetical protein